MSIITRPIAAASAVVCDAARLDYTPLAQGDIAAMMATCQMMRRIARRSIDTVPRVVLRVPSHVLATPLSERQRHMVDELATGEIADICVVARAEIAQIPIDESGEPLVNLHTCAHQSGVVMTFSDVPYPKVSGPKFAGKPQLFWARQSFAERLVVMARILAPLGIVLHVEEAFRPYEVQAGMFRRRLARTRREHPSWTDEQVMAEACSKTASTPRLASHMAGVAADVFLRDTVSGELLDFGHTYPDGGAIVHPASPFVTREQWKNRQTLEVAAQLACLAVYVGEDWHVSYGDNLWAWQTGAEAAVYGAVKEFSLKTGVITSEFVGDELDQQFFS